METSRHGREAPTEAAAETILTYFKDFESDLPVRVSGGDLCAAEAPTEPVGETRGDIFSAVIFTNLQIVHNYLLTIFDEWYRICINKSLRQMMSGKQNSF